MTEDEERRSVATPVGTDGPSDPHRSLASETTSGSVPPDMPMPVESIGSTGEPSGFDHGEDGRPIEAAMDEPDSLIGVEANSGRTLASESIDKSDSPSFPPPVDAQPARRFGLLPALLGLVTLLLLGAVGYLFYTMPDASQLSAMESALGDLRSRVAALETHPAAPGIDALKGQIASATQQLGSLKSDLGAMQQRVAALDAPKQGGTAAGDLDPTRAALGVKLAELDQGLGAMKSEIAKDKPDLSPITTSVSALQDHLAALQTKVDDIPPVDLGPVNARLDKLDGQLKPIVAEAQAAKNPDRVTAMRENGSAAETRAAPLAVTAQAVLRAIEAGRPFPADLKALQSLGAEATLLAPLQSVAEAGAPTTQDLRSDLAGVRDRLLAQSAPKPSGSYMDRLMAGAATLVQVRPLGSVVGDSPSAVLARMDDDLAEDNLASALAEWQKLPEASRSVAKGLADRIRLRQSAEEAARGIGADAIKAMASAQQ